MARSAVTRWRCAASQASNARNAASATVSIRIATSDVVLERTPRKRRASDMTPHYTGGRRGGNSVLAGGVRECQHHVSAGNGAAPNGANAEGRRLPEGAKSQTARKSLRAPNHRRRQARNP